MRASRPGRADVNGDFRLDITVRHNLCVFTCAGGGHVRATYHGGAGGFALASCVAEGAHDLEGGEHSIVLEPSADKCPTPEFAMFCVEGVYDSDDMACRPEDPPEA